MCKCAFKSILEHSLRLLVYVFFCLFTFDLVFCRRVCQPRRTTLLHSLWLACIGIPSAVYSFAIPFSLYISRLESPPFHPSTMLLGWQRHIRTARAEKSYAKMGYCLAPKLWASYANMGSVGGMGYFALRKCCVSFIATVEYVSMGYVQWCTLCFPMAVMLANWRGCATVVLATVETVSVRFVYIWREIIL